MDSRSVVAEKLLQINAVKINPSAPFTWASGWKSPIYCDNRKILSYPEARDFIKHEMAKTIREYFADAGLVAGVATAGIAWGALVADELKLPYIYVRPKPKEHGLGNQIEGYYEAGNRVVIIEDLVSTGKSSLQVAEVLRQKELKIEGMVSIFDYGFDVAADAFKDAGIRLKSLSDYNSLISVAITNGIVSADAENTLLNWRKYPSNWKQVN